MTTKQQTTPAAGNLPKIEWEIQDISNDRCAGRTTTHMAFGESKDGRQWFGWATLTDGDFVDVQEVEQELEQ